MRRIVTITACEERSINDDQRGEKRQRTESRLAAVLSFFRLRKDSATMVDVSDLFSAFPLSSAAIVG